jgi:predicted lipid-binding transport protein (Tim44 family)
MDTHRRPPVLDMTPEGEFRDPAPPPRPGRLDRILGRVGGLALLVALATGGLVLAAVAIFFAALALPVLIVAGAIGAGSLWWRLRRLRRQGGPGAVRFVVIRR